MKTRKITETSTAPLRRDFTLGRFGLIVRTYRDPAQYGLLMWRNPNDGWTLDIWVKQTLYTLRRYPKWMD